MHTPPFSKMQSEPTLLSGEPVTSSGKYKTHNNAYIEHKGGGEEGFLIISAL